MQGGSSWPELRVDRGFGWRGEGGGGRVVGNIQEVVKDDGLDEEVGKMEKVEEEGVEEVIEGSCLQGLTDYTFESCPYKPTRCILRTIGRPGIKSSQLSELNPAQGRARKTTANKEGGNVSKTPIKRVK